MCFFGNRALIAFLIGLSFVSCMVSAEGEARVKELRQLAAETPTFPGFEQSDYSDISKSEGTVVTYFYRSSATYENVKSFYTKALLSRGWSSPEEEPINHWFVQDGSRRLIFRKGEYTIDLNYEPAGGNGWRFAVDYDWQPKRNSND